MKSQQLEKIETSCKPCVFAQFDNNTQTGCQANRLTHFDDKDIVPCYDNDKEFFVINKLCTSFRPVSWNDGDPDVDKMQNENAVEFSFVVFCDDVDEDGLDSLEKDIDAMNYDPTKVELIIAHDEKFAHRDKIAKIVRYVKSIGMKYTIVEYFSDLPKYFKELEAFKKITKPYFLVPTFKHTYFGLFYFGSFNNLINQEYKRISVCNTGNGIIMSTKLLTYYVDDYEKFEKEIVEAAQDTSYYYNYNI